MLQIFVDAISLRYFVSYSYSKYP